MKHIESFNGWFGEIAKDANYESISIIAETLANYYKKNSSPGQKLVIGYDTRYFAKEFAEFIACIMAKKGVKVFLSNRPAPSSVSIVSALHKKSLGTLVVTGDEFNAKYVGIRAYDMRGFFLDENDISSYKDDASNKPVSSLKEYMKKGIIELFDTSIIYELFVHRNISFDEMTPAINQLLFNPFYGSGMYYFDYILRNQKIINGVTIDSSKVTDFKSKEPNPKSLYKYMYTDMIEDDLDLGFILSPDCTSFEFLVGNERLTKIEILHYLIDLLATNDTKLNILISDENNINVELLDPTKVNVQLTSQKDFYLKLKNDEFDISMDNFERFYFKNHGSPDALLCGFYLFLFFNRKDKVTENARVFLNKLRTK